MEDIPELSEWSTPSTESVHLNLTRAGRPLYAEAFQPTFTYQIFGEEEIIPGYKDLNISINFRAHDLKPTLKIKYAQKLPAINDTMADLMDVEGKLRKFLPESAVPGNGSNTDGASNGISSSWKPPGELMHTYKNFGKTFEIWQSSLADARAKEILSNMAIFIPFFIEGGTVDFLDEPDWAHERWKLFLLYHVENEDYTLAGFSTSYRLWVFPTTDVLKTMQSQSPSSQLPPSSLPHDSSFSDTSSFDEIEKVSALDLPSRERISQFIILPPYQKQSHGSWLYVAMTTLFRQDKWVFEITVEEPNEDFDTLRDYCDMAYLNSMPTLPNMDVHFKDVNISDTIPIEDLAADNLVPTDQLLPLEALNILRHNAKIAPRQFQRLVEIHLLDTIPPRYRSTARQTRKSAAPDRNDRAYYFWRLLVKERIFMKNRDQLLQIDEAERVGKVEETVAGVEDEYVERIDGYRHRVDRGLEEIMETLGAERQAGEGAASSTGQSRRKRKVIGDDEDEGEAEKTTPVGKKMRLGGTLPTS